MSRRGRNRSVCLASLVLVVALVPAASSAAAHHLSYRAGARSVDLTIDTAEIAVRTTSAAEVAEAQRRLNGAPAARSTKAAEAPGLSRLQLAKPAGSDAEVLDLVAALNQGSARWVFTPVLRIGKTHV